MGSARGSIAIVFCLTLSLALNLLSGTVSAEPTPPLPTEEVGRVEVLPTPFRPHWVWVSAVTILFRTKIACLTGKFRPRQSARPRPGRPGTARPAHRAGRAPTRESRTGAALHRSAPPTVHLPDSPRLDASPRAAPGTHIAQETGPPAAGRGIPLDVSWALNDHACLRHRGPPSTPSSRASKSKLQSSHAPHLTCSSCRSGFPTGLRLLAG